MSITFRVDDVEPVLSLSPQMPLRECATRALSTEVYVVSHENSLVEDRAGGRRRQTNQLLACVHRAFAEHRPLTLSPDHVWLAIAQGFAIHVEQNAEQLRDRFVRHEQSVTLTTRARAVPQSAPEWEEVVGRWSALIGEHLGPGLVRLLDCDFSTTTNVERTAARVVAMSAFKKYFNYELVCICGIPSVTLEGGAEDWKNLRQRLDVLEEYDLKWWVRCLRPVADQLVATAEGHPDLDFWRSIYKPKEAYGGATATGWLMRLFPYLSEDPTGFTRSPAAQKEKNKGVRENQWIGRPVAPSAVPYGLNFAPVSVAVDEKKLSFMLFSGFVGYRQIQDGSLRPEVAWGVGEPSRSVVAINELLATPGCSSAPPSPIRHEALPRGVVIPAELIELYAYTDGFSCGDFVVFPSSKLRPIIHREDGGGITVTNTYGLTFGSFAGKPLSYVLGAKRSLPIVFFEGDASAWEPEDIPVVAESFGELLGAITSRVPLVPLGMLYDRLPEGGRTLRRALRRAEGSPVHDLTRRERHQLVMEIKWGNGTPEQQEFWWQSLRRTLGLDQPKDAYFGTGRSVFEICKLMADE